MAALTLNHCVLENNTAKTGGAIFNSYGTLNMNYCTVRDNTNTTMFGGGPL